MLYHPGAIRFGMIKTGQSREAYQRTTPRCPRRARSASGFLSNVRCCAASLTFVRRIAGPVHAIRVRTLLRGSVNTSKGPRHSADPSSLVLERVGHEVQHLTK